MSNIHYQLYSDFMIQKKNDFFSMSKDEQDSFKVENHDNFAAELRWKAYSHFAKNKNHLSIEEVRDMDIPRNYIHDVNKVSTYFLGIGENYFYFNENMQDEENILSFESLYDYDYSSFTFQMKSIAEYNNKVFDLENTPYYLSLWAHWSRAFLKENDVFSHKYLLLSSAANYICGIIDDLSMDLIDSLVPFDFDIVNNENNIKQLTLNANGKEDLYRAISSFSNDYLAILSERLAIVFDNLNPGVWAFPDKDDEDSIHYVISNKSAAKLIILKSFQKDTDALISKSDDSFLENMIEKEKSEYILKMKEKYNSLIEK